MRIVQMLPSLGYGDAIGNDVLALDDAMREAGYDTAIYAVNIDERLSGDRIHPVSEYVDAPSTTVIYHLSIGDALNDYAATLTARLLIIYHNITPLHFLYPEFPFPLSYALRGRDQMRALGKKAVAAFGDSDYNRRELVDAGYTCPTEVLPILIRFPDYEKTPSAEVMERYKNDTAVKVNFTGRMSPNKCIHDVMAAFAYYQKAVNEDSRLFLVGFHTETRPYYPALKRYEEQLGARNILFSGHIPFDQILAYYRSSDVFVCLSEHEGFCVPLVEAMYFGIPIIAYDCAAVGETLGDGGLLLQDKSPAVVGEAINLVMTDDALRQTLIEKGRERLKYFDNARIKAQFLGYLKKYL
ncbi:MAG: glycosyltransferase family 4 protein [Lachnospiraceae bacterium]|nr:glycosyltransferase family 4 protein [Lachnospiraceae bacterium]